MLFKSTLILYFNANQWSQDVILLWRRRFFMRNHCGLAKVQGEDFTLHALRQIAIFRHASDTRVCVPTA